MAEVQEAERKASQVQSLNKSADGLSMVEGRETSAGEKELLAAAAQVKQEAHDARSADGEARARGQESAKPEAPAVSSPGNGNEAQKEQPVVPRIGQRVTFRQNDGNDAGITGKVSALDEKTVTMDCGEKRITAIRDKGTFHEAPALKRDQTKKFGVEKAQELMGEGCKIYFAQEKGRYEGEIVGTTGTYAIQKVNDDTAVLHRLQDLSVGGKEAQIKTGDSLSIVKNGAGISISPFDREKKEKEQAAQQQKNRSREGR